MEMREDEVQTIKDWMYERELTKREALAYMACVIHGMTASEYAEQIGCSRPLITTRLNSARRKMEGLDDS